MRQMHQQQQQPPTWYLPLDLSSTLNYDNLSKLLKWPETEILF